MSNVNVIIRIIMFTLSCMFTAISDLGMYHNHIETRHNDINIIIF